MTLRSLNYGNYGICLSTGNAGFISSTLGFRDCRVLGLRVVGLGIFRVLGLRVVGLGICRVLGLRVVGLGIVGF